MSGEPGDHADEHVTVREYFEALLLEKDRRDEQRFDAQEKAVRDALIAAKEQVQQALISAQQAVDKAEKAASERFASVNEFRGQLSDQVATFVRREYMDAQLEALNRRLAEIATARQAAIDEARLLTAGLLPREVFEHALSQSLAERQELRDRISGLEGELKAARRASTAYVTAVGFGVTALTIALTILTLVLRP